MKGNSDTSCNWSARNDAQMLCKVLKQLEIRERAETIETT